MDRYNRYDRNDRLSIAVFPGSFDPFTEGHQVIVHRALRLFDKVIVAVGVNSDKEYMFTAEERMAMIHQRFEEEDRVEVVCYSDMTVELCHRMNAQFIVRGIRDEKDLHYEQTVAAVNHTLDPNIETVILLADLEHQNISSTIERERLRHMNCC